LSYGSNSLIPALSSARLQKRRWRSRATSISAFISNAFYCRMPNEEIVPMAKKSTAAAAMAEKVQVARSRAAERMRRYRQRRRAGLRSYRLELRASEIEALVRRGLLLAAEKTNRNAVTKAMYAFFDSTLGRSA
jgi:hypothetical protein